MTFYEYLAAKWSECSPDEQTGEMSQQCRDYNALLLLIDKWSEPNEIGKKISWLNKQLESHEASVDLIQKTQKMFYDEYYKFEVRRSKPTS